MGRIKVLYETDRELMLAFSRLCVERLNNYLPLKIFLSPFQGFLDANVGKEIEKDRLIIEHTAGVFERGRQRADIDLEGLFEMTVRLDSDFVRKLSNSFFSIDIRYAELEQVRKERITALAGMVYDLLSNWGHEASFPETVKSTYRKEDYREVLAGVLHLYNVETKALSNSITLHGPAGAVKDLFSGKLFSVMEETAREIAAAYAHKVFPDRDAQQDSPMLRRTDLQI